MTKSLGPGVQGRSVGLAAVSTTAEVGGTGEMGGQAGAFPPGARSLRQ